MIVKELTYAKIIIFLFDKLPKSILFGMLRTLGKSTLDCSLIGAINALDDELEVQQSHASLLRALGGAQANVSLPRKPAISKP